jgi:spore cortex-lytic enzyme
MKPKKIAILTLVLMLMFFSLSYNDRANAANIVKGDTYANIVAVQTVLKKWGYYTGAVDGVFGPKTRTAVINFQKKNGLVADGIVGSRTEAALGLNLGSSNVSASGKNIVKGDTAVNIKAVQTVLKKWGYYTGAVDGVFGPKTRAAVISFQKKNGLTADGIVGSRTEAAMGLNLGGAAKAASTTGSNELYLLAKCIYAEARGEPYEGQVAIGAVVLNRVKDSRFPNTISGVIYQPGAFTAVADGQINLSPNQTAINAANDALNGWDPTYGCLYYYNPATATSKWIWSLPVVLKIGKHSFCKG